MNATVKFSTVNPNDFFGILNHEFCVARGTGTRFDFCKLSAVLGAENQADYGTILIFFSFH
jgi:hypothetical protein